MANLNDFRVQFTTFKWEMKQSNKGNPYLQLFGYIPSMNKDPQDQTKNKDNNLSIMFYGDEAIQVKDIIERNKTPLNSGKELFKGIFQGFLDVNQYVNKLGEKVFALELKFPAVINDVNGNNLWTRPAKGESPKQSSNDDTDSLPF